MRRRMSTRNPRSTRGRHRAFRRSGELRLERGGRDTKRDDTHHDHCADAVAYVRCRVNPRSRSGVIASSARATERPLPARRYHDALAGAARQARSPGTRSAAQATARPAIAWPKGLGMGAL